jgi:hypothetical protein
LVQLVTLWLLSITTSDDVAIHWSLWRIADAALLLVNLAVFALYQGGVSYKPPLVVAVFVAGAIFTDLSSLIIFVMQYISCVNLIEDGETLTDPLCMTSDLKVVGGYHIGIISVLFAGAIANLYVPISMIRLRDSKRYESVAEIIADTKIENAHEARRARRILMIHRAITIFIGCVLILVLEVSIITSASDIKYLWFCHILILIPALFSSWPVLLANYRINKYMTFISALAFTGSCLGVGLMTWYFLWLCDTVPPRTGFSNFTTCEIGRTASIYFLVLHCILAGISLVRLFAYVYTLRESGALAFREREIIARSDLIASGVTMNPSADASIRRRFVHMDGDVILEVTGKNGKMFV